MKPHFIRVLRSDGNEASLRVDAITALMPQMVKGVEQVAVQLGPTLIIHAIATEGQIKQAMADSTGIPVQEFDARPPKAA